MQAHRPPVAVIGLDGDDTLWHNESIFAATHDRLRTLVERYTPADDLDDRLLATERRNLDVFGYGVKGFALSMIETAIAVTAGRVEAHDIAQIVDWTREMLRHPVELLDGVTETVADLATRYRLALITKGDMFHQESKIARSGIAGHFDVIEIVAEKDPDTYRRVLDRAGIDPASFLMVGNSLRSDVLPVLDVGGHAVHIPYHVTWQHEQVAEHEHDGTAYTRLGDVRELPGLLAADTCPRTTCRSHTGAAGAGVPCSPGGQAEHVRRTTDGAHGLGAAAPRGRSCVDEW